MAADDAPVWYAMRHYDRTGVPVRFLLHGGEATGFVKLERIDGRQVLSYWVRRDSGAVDRLPYEPRAWRPLPGQPWPSPLPEPMRIAQEGRMVDIRPHRLRRMQEQAEQSAATMAELEREHGPLGGADPRSRNKKNQWWLDPAAVTYSEPGHISLLEAEGRVCRAILTDGLRALDKPPAFAGVAAGLAHMVAETITSADADRAPRFQPLPRDHDDYLTAFGWFARIAPIELRPRWAGPDWLSGAQKVLVWQAVVPPWSWRQIARYAGGSQEGWRKTWGGALEMVRRVANGEQPLTHVRVADQLAALQERNRAFRRSA